MYKLINTIFLFLIISLCSIPSCDTIYASQENIKTYIYKNKWIRILYHTAGKDAIHIIDRNSNGIPDLVDDIATQLIAAQHIFCNIYNYQNPLLSNRFPDVSSIIVIIRNKDNMFQHHGEALDTIINTPGGDGKEKSLLIYIAKDIDVSSSSTVLHEYFHLIQYSMTYFASNWFTEGMARWAEDALDVRDPKKTAVDILKALYNERFLEILHTTSYNAVNMLWNPLSLSLDNSKKISLEDTDVLLKMKYANGSRVLKDKNFCGADLMLCILKNMGIQDKKAKTALHYDNWTKKEGNPWQIFPIWSKHYVMA